MNNQTRSNPCWQLGLVSILVVGGAIASSGEYALAQVTLDQSASSQLTICDLNIDSQTSSCDSSNSGLSGYRGIDIGPAPGNPNGHDQGVRLGNTQVVTPGTIQQLPAGTLQQLTAPGTLQQQFNRPITGN